MNSLLAMAQASDQQQFALNTTSVHKIAYMKISVVGASGYVGTELLRLLSSHDEFEVVLATGESAAGRTIAGHAPSLAGAYRDQVYAATDDVFSVQSDLVFLALPHGSSQAVAPRLLESGAMVVDLGADFRLTSPSDYATWYGHEHTAPQLLGSAIYGLVERHRSELPGARLIASPGCYPTAASLALGPFVDAGVIDRRGIVINALSGVSGAGRTPSERLHFPRLHANAEAYGVLHHRHTVEIQQELAADVIFTPHLVPVSRGMLVTAYGRATANFTTEMALELLRATYADEPFVVVSPEPPSLKDALGSNLCFVSAQVDPRTGWLVAMSSLDNLTKGAAGQAIQAANVALGLPEVMGLVMAGVAP